MLQTAIVIQSFGWWWTKSGQQRVRSLLPQGWRMVGESKSKAVVGKDERWHWRWRSHAWRDLPQDRWCCWEPGKQKLMAGLGLGGAGLWGQLVCPPWAWRRGQQQGRGVPDWAWPCFLLWAAFVDGERHSPSVVFTLVSTMFNNKTVFII